MKLQLIMYSGIGIVCIVLLLKSYKLKNAVLYYSLILTTVLLRILFTIVKTLSMVDGAISILFYSTILLTVCVWSALLRRYVLKDSNLLFVNRNL